MTEPQASKSLRDYIQEKYQGRRIDLVVAVTDVALQFVLQYRNDLFPSAPIVFAGFFPPAAEIRHADPGITGAVMAEGYEETLALALRLHPSTTQVFVVAKWPELRFDSLQADLRAFESRVRIQYLTEESLSDVLKAVRAAPPRQPGSLHSIRGRQQRLIDKRRGCAHGRGSGGGSGLWCGGVEYRQRCGRRRGAIS